MQSHQDAAIPAQEAKSLSPRARNCWPSAIEEAKETKRTEWRKQGEENQEKCRAQWNSRSIQPVRNQAG